MGTSHPGQLVDRGTSKRTKVAQERWSKPPDFGRGTESPGTAGSPPGPSDPNTSCPEELLEPAGTCRWAELPKTPARPCRPLGMGPSDPGDLVDPMGTRTQA